MNGYDAHSLKATGLDEMSSSSSPLVAIRDKRQTRTGLGFRSEQPYPGGTASRKRGSASEAANPWSTAQAATTPQIKPRAALPPEKDREGDEDE